MFWNILGLLSLRLLCWAGEACSIVALSAEGATEADDLGMRDELCTQHLHPPQHFIVASTAGLFAFPFSPTMSLK